MKDEAMKLALEALDGGHIDRAYGYIQEALAQPEHPEQMARLGWQYVECPACESAGARAFPKPYRLLQDNGSKYFGESWDKAEQPAQQQEEPVGSVYRYGKDSSGTPWHGIHWNAAGLDLPDGTLIYTSPPAQPAQQEPVAWLRKSDLVELRACNHMRLGADSPSIWAPNAPDEPSPDTELVAVYTSPPAQRKPLTLREIGTVCGNFSNETIKVVRQTEAAHGIKENT